jgi:hypothetical protein
MKYCLNNVILALHLCVIYNNTSQATHQTTHGWVGKMESNNTNNNMINKNDKGKVLSLRRDDIKKKEKWVV